MTIDADTLPIVRGLTESCEWQMLSNLKHLDKDGGGVSANPMAVMGVSGPILWPILYQKDILGTKTTPEQDIEVSIVSCEQYKEAVLRQC